MASIGASIQYSTEPASGIYKNGTFPLPNRLSNHVPPLIHHKQFPPKSCRIFHKVVYLYCHKYIVQNERRVLQCLIQLHAWKSSPCQMSF